MVVDKCDLLLHFLKSDGVFYESQHWSKALQSIKFTASLYVAWLALKFREIGSKRLNEFMEFIIWKELYVGQGDKNKNKEAILVVAVDADAQTVWRRRHRRLSKV